MPDGIADAKHQVVSHEQWIAARKALLAKEKEFSRQRDEDPPHRPQDWVRHHDKYGA